jgi:hypothetical protein
VVVGAMLPAASQQDTTLALCDTNRSGYEKNVNTGKKGFSPGDGFVFSDPLLNRQSGNRAGRLVGQITFLRIFRQPQDVLFHAHVSIQFPKGKVTVFGHGKFRGLRNGFKLPITGGTGRYNGAGGNADIQSGKCRGKPGIRITLNVQ